MGSITPNSIRNDTLRWVFENRRNLIGQPLCQMALACENYSLFEMIEEFAGPWKFCGLAILYFLALRWKCNILIERLDNREPFLISYNEGKPADLYLAYNGANHYAGLVDHDVNVAMPTVFFDMFPTDVATEIKKASEKIQALSAEINMQTKYINHLTRGKYFSFSYIW